MPRKTTPSFIAELPLATTWRDERTLRIRLEKAKDLYNGVLCEALKRCDAMRADPRWQAAGKMPQKTAKEKQARRKAFAELVDEFGFTQNSLDAFEKDMRGKCSIGYHLTGHDAQSTAKRAFESVQQYSFGKRGRPRFKRRMTLHSIQGKEDNKIYVRKGKLLYEGLKIPVIYDPKSQWQALALRNPVKHTRVIRREVKGKWRWYAQVVLEGKPPILTPVGNDVVGLDLGPSTIASYGGGEARQEVFCASVKEPWAEHRRIQRAMDRSRRATNPDCFDDKGRFKKGKKIKVRSKGYQALAQRKREHKRRLAAERKRAHGEMANKIIARGKIVKTEKLSYKAFQKRFGRSVQVRAPATFVNMLSRKAANAGGHVLLINTWHTRLSQFDHTTGDFEKKPLSKRVHVFRDGVTQPVGRDLYSAFLARHCSDEKTIDVMSVIKDWPSAELHLRQAGVEWNQSARTEASGQSHGRRRKAAVRQSGSLADFRLASERSSEDHSCGAAPVFLSEMAENASREAASIVTPLTAA